MKRIQIPDGTHRILQAMADTDGVAVGTLISAMAMRELDRRRERYDARDKVRDLNGELLRP